MTGMGRMTARAAVAAGALAVTALTGAAAEAAAGAAVPPASPAGVFTVTSTGSATGAGAGAWRLPRNFLLYEAQARKPVRYPEEEEWTISDRRRDLGLRPCGPGRPVDAGRVGTRTVTYSAPEFYKAEQVTVYRSERAARAAVADVLKRVGRCRDDTSDQVVFKGWTERVEAGDQAARVVIQSYDRGSGRPAIGGQRAVVVRKGRAVAIYVRAGEYGQVRRTDFSRQLKDARKMAAKVCSLPGVC
ncbi:hypothetical protein GCM10010466_22660 [Planomonospora alba]|uniref:PknH-like extracellular domain-containing protein n=1 Tax=Planomonospora alba TaxID=161354 RepID=A0ABP6N2F0_9ACTN